MAIHDFADVDLIVHNSFITEIVMVVLYEHPVNQSLMQYLRQAAGLQQIVGNRQYRVLVATHRQHFANGEMGKGDIVLLTTSMFSSVPEDVHRFADALTGGDTQELYRQLKAIEDSLRVVYGQFP